MFPVIESITVRPNRQLLLHYVGGEKVLVDFQSLIERGGVFASLAEPQYFAQVKLGERGRYIEWPGGLDFCSDALWEEGEHRFPHPDPRVAQSDTQVAGHIHFE